MILAAGGYYFGYYVGIMNPLGTPLAKDVYDLKTKTQVDEFNGNVNFYFCIGTFIACFIAGILADAVGRIRVIMLTEVLCFVTSYLYTVQNLNVLYAVRFVSGLVTGMIAGVVPVALAEMFPPAISGFGGLFFYLCLTGFILLGWFSPIFCGNNQPSLVSHSTFILAWPAVVGALRLGLIAFFFKFGGIESPGFFLKKLNLDDEDSVESTSERLRQWYRTVYTEKDTELMILNNINKQRETRNEVKPTLSAMFSTRYRFRFITGCLINILQQFSGVNFLVIFSTNLFNRISNNGATMTLVIGAANIGGGLLGLFTVEKFGRRFNLMFGSLVQAFGFILLVIGSTYSIGFLSVIAVLVYMTAFGMGMGGTLPIFCAEIIPAIGNGIANSAQWMTASIIVKVLPTLTTSLGPTVLLLFFITVSFFNVFFVNYTCVETKGLSMDEVETVYLGGITKSKSEQNFLVSRIF